MIAFGYSQTGSLLLEMVRSGQNRDEDGALIFDGVLAGGHDGWCLVPDNDATPRPGPGPRSRYSTAAGTAMAPFRRTASSSQSRPKRTSMRSRATGSGMTRQAFGSTSWPGSPIFRRTSTVLS